MNRKLVYAIAISLTVGMVPSTIAIVAIAGYTTVPCLGYVDPNATAIPYRAPLCLMPLLFVLGGFLLLISYVMSFDESQKDRKDDEGTT